MDSREFAVRLGSDPLMKNIWLGCFPCDEIPMKITKKPVAMVWNTHPRDGVGEHWVAVFVPASGPIEYFDSFAAKIENKYFRKFLKNKDYIRNYQRVQGNMATTCGFYCAYFLVHRAAGISFRDTIDPFHCCNFSFNDAFVTDWVNLRYHCEEEVFDETLF